MATVYTNVKRRATMPGVDKFDGMASEQARRTEYSARVRELEVAIANALGALGLPGSCPEEHCAGCEAERYAAFESLAATGIKPAGFEHYPVDIQEIWSDSLGNRPEQHGKDL